MKHTQDTDTPDTPEAPDSRVFLSYNECEFSALETEPLFACMVCRDEYALDGPGPLYECDEDIGCEYHKGYPDFHEDLVKRAWKVMSDEMGMGGPAPRDGYQVRPHNIEWPHMWKLLGHEVLCDSQCHGFRHVSDLKDLGKVWEYMHTLSHHVGCSPRGGGYWHYFRRKTEVFGCLHTGADKHRYKRVPARLGCQPDWYAWRWREDVCESCVCDTNASHSTVGACRGCPVL